MTAELFMGVAEPIDLRPAHADRLASKVLEAFNLACDVEDADAAQDLLRAAEAILSRNGLQAVSQWGRIGQSLVDAHYRLWEIRYLVR